MTVGCDCAVPRVVAECAAQAGTLVGFGFEWEVYKPISVGLCGIGRREDQWTSRFYTCLLPPSIATDQGS